MNNRGQNVNPNGTPQNHHPNQGNPQLNNQNQGNVYNGQNPQYNNQQYQGYNNNQNPQYNNQQYQGYNNNQNPQYNNQQYQGYNNNQNPQFRGQSYNGQNTQFNNMNKQQSYINSGGYNNPNQFNQQFGQNNPNFYPVKTKSILNNKTIGIIAAIATAVVVMMVILVGGNNKTGGSTPQGAVEGWLNAIKADEYEKMINYVHFETKESREKAIAEYSNISEEDRYKFITAKQIVVSIEIGETDMIDDKTAKVTIKSKKDDFASIFGSSSRAIKVIKVDGRWYIMENPF